jgi:nucleosome binding factor SPN SPT16 subunit
MQEDLTFNSIQVVFSQGSVELSWNTVLQQLAMEKPVTVSNIGL